MRTEFSRRFFLGLVPATLALPHLSCAAPPEISKMYTLFPTQDPDLVRTMVGASHANLAKVKELLELHPSLANAAWDWGFGDWETPLGAASHVGSLEIVALLLKNGALPDLFTHVTMGHLDAVKAIIGANPGIQRVRGPHGITLLAHAEPDTPTHAYLAGLGDADISEPNQATTDEEKAIYPGIYRAGGNEDVFEVAMNSRKILQLKRGQTMLNLRKVESHGFAPPGAPSVRIRFRVESGKAISMTIHDPEPVWTGLRG